MRLSYARFPLLILVAVLAGCQTTDNTAPVPSNLIGRGELVMGAPAQTHFERYRNKRNPAYFAIDTKGGATGWTYCTGGPDACDGEPSKEKSAILNCEKRTHLPCKILARGWEIIWNGSVKYEGVIKRKDIMKRDALNIRREGMDPQLAGMSIKDVCEIAVDYSTKPYEWSRMPEARAYVAEAIGRNVLIYQCAFETGRQ